MLKEFLKGNIKIVESVSNWEEALKIGARSLVDNGNIEEKYIQAIIDDVYKYGPYIVLTEGAAMPHSRPENGVLKKGMSFLKVKNGVDFYKTDEKVYLFFTLAAENADGHQEAISELAEFLSNNEKLEKMIKEDFTEDEILSFL
ncbi:PTS sugar transporter subunit IIA [Brachyspira hampsonii]|uniref:PTS IIA-like nitrogen-regulatory protein PtsN n=1 Tax=Brachyspira hampsonii 30446 TaxID=1289135 RepID=A0A2U4EWZ4_9SPIR|nr:PTS sugar transporter subunit IIA [Brachyspira hampsonii]EKV57656.1 PTS IIA-like nitrogen-regulatory protein PtsN [Brachyspira hampsonii 30446]MBW5389315.1 PTS sugar transporter subunit IIA [Brachyspira hampsonii]MBW5393806.1 PTS sugar transporter subunit IIA [Brachyspira hampsonii]OEJ20626.1 PTS sugar transporter subunit IIA [Brachyspira hampsonii]